MKAVRHTNSKPGGPMPNQLLKQHINVSKTESISWSLNTDGRIGELIWDSNGLHHGGQCHQQGRQVKLSFKRDTLSYRWRKPTNGSRISRLLWPEAEYGLYHWRAGITTKEQNWSVKAKDNFDIDIQYYAMVDFKPLRQPSAILPEWGRWMSAHHWWWNQPGSSAPRLNMKDGVVPQQTIKVGK